jgi:RND family efflux transporter MFP subunit
MKQFYILFFILFCALSMLQSQMMKQGDPDVVVDYVTEINNIETRRYTGLIVSPARVQLVSRVAGDLIKVGFKEGDFVKKGQLLYQLDPIRYKATVKSVEAQIAESKAKLDYATATYERSFNLFKKQTSSQNEVDNTKSDMEACKAALDAREATLITAQDDLKNTKIIAPISGYIGITNYTVGNYLTPNSGVLATIIQTDPVRVRFSMSNRDFLSLFNNLDNLKKMSEIKVQLADDSYYDQPGEVELINNEANARTDTIQIYVKFSNPQKRLIIGSTVTVTLTSKQTKLFPAVPISAIMYDSKGTPYVYSIDNNNMVSRKEVITGAFNGEFQIIRKGLEKGELIIVDGNHKAMPNIKINPHFKNQPKGK